MFSIFDPLTWSKKFLGYWPTRLLTRYHQLLSSMRATYLPHRHHCHCQAVSITRQLFFCERNGDNYSPCPSDLRASQCNLTEWLICLSFSHKRPSLTPLTWNMKPCDTVRLPFFFGGGGLQRCFFACAQTREEKKKRRRRKRENRAQHVFCAATLKRSLDRLGCSSKTFLPPWSRMDTVERKMGGSTSVSKHLLTTSSTVFFLVLPPYQLCLYFSSGP